MTVEPTIPSSSPGAGALLRLIRDGQASTRAELVALTGLARSTVAQRMDALLSQRLVVPAGGSVSTGGRPPQMFAFNRDAGVVLAADLGATHSRLAVTDLGGEVLVEGAEEIAIAEGPEAVLAWLEQTFDELLAERRALRTPTSAASASASRARSSSRPARRSRRRSCPAGTATA